MFLSISPQQLRAVVFEMHDVSCVRNKKQWLQYISGIYKDILMIFGKQILQIMSKIYIIQHLHDISIVKLCYNGLTYILYTNWL